MNTQEIYEKNIMQADFNKKKFFRNQWSDKDKEYGLRTIVDIGGSDYSNYRFAMDACTENVYEMIQNVVIELLCAYEIPVKLIELTRNDAHVYYVNDSNEPWRDFVEQNNKRRILAFIKKTMIKKSFIYSRNMVCRIGFQRRCYNVSQRIKELNTIVIYPWLKMMLFQRY